MSRRTVVWILSLAAVALLGFAAGTTHALRQIAPILLVGAGLAVSASRYATRWPWAGPSTTALGLAIAASESIVLASLAGVVAMLALNLPERPSRAWSVSAGAVATTTLAFLIALPAAVRPNADVLTPAFLLLVAGSLLGIAAFIRAATARPKAQPPETGAMRRSDPS